MAPELLYNLRCKSSASPSSSSRHSSSLAPEKCTPVTLVQAKVGRLVGSWPSLNPTPPRAPLPREGLGANDQWEEWESESEGA